MKGGPGFWDTCTKSFPTQAELLAMGRKELRLLISMGATIDIKEALLSFYANAHGVSRKMSSRPCKYQILGDGTCEVDSDCAYPLGAPYQVEPCCMKQPGRNVGYCGACVKAILDF